MIESRSLFTRNVNQLRQLISFNISNAILTKEYLHHTGMISDIVSWPRRTILHCPAFLGNFLSHCDQTIYPNFKFFIFSLYCTPFPDKCGVNFVFEIVDFLRKIPFWSPGFNIKLFAEGNPFPSKFRCLGKGFKCKHCSTVI
nr:hypothetical protein PanWU01x14_267450 [Ipomoea batatas]